MVQRAAVLAAQLKRRLEPAAAVAAAAAASGDGEQPQQDAATAGDVVGLCKRVCRQLHAAAQDAGSGAQQQLLELQAAATRAVGAG